MRKVMTIILVVIVICFAGCSKSKIADEVVKEKADINNLFTSNQEITSIATMRVDTVYTIDSKELIDELMNLLKDNTYTEIEKGNLKEDIGDTKTGSRSNGVHIVIKYKDGISRDLDMFFEEDVYYIDYSEIYEKPYKVIENRYISEKNIWSKVLYIMFKGF